MGEDPHLIMERNDRAREELAHDINVLTERLNVKKQVDTRKEEVVGNIKERLGMDTHQGAGGTASNEAGAVLSAVASNPIATLALGYGAKTLFSSWRRKHEQYQHGEGYYGTPTGRYEYAYRSDIEGGPVAGGEQEGMRERAGRTGQDVSERAGHMKEDVSRRTGQMREEASQRAQHMREEASQRAGHMKEELSHRAGSLRESMPSSSGEMQRSMRDHLTLVGMGAFAVGAAAGMLAPRSRMEQEKLGQVRHELAQNVQQQAEHVREAAEVGIDRGVDAVKEGMQEAQHAAQEKLQEEQKAEAPQ